MEAAGVELQHDPLIPYRCGTFLSAFLAVVAWNHWVGLRNDWGETCKCLILQGRVLSRRRCCDLAELSFWAPSGRRLLTWLADGGQVVVVGGHSVDLRRRGGVLGVGWRAGEGLLVVG